MRHLALVLLVLGLGLSGCDRAAGQADASGKKGVVCTTTVVGDLVRQIAGDKVSLRVIMPAGKDPHGYDAKPQDIALLKSADLIFYNGLHLEGTMVELLEHSLGGKAVAVTRDMPRDRLLPWAQGGSTFDPHVWHDASLWAFAATTVGEELAKLDPPNAAEYRARAAGVVKDLTALHEELKSRLAQVPAERRVLVTSHDAYNYFGRAYGVEVKGLQGISTETEAGIASIQNAVELVVTRRIPAIFVESSVNPKTIERVQADAKARGLDVKIGGELYSDALGVPGEHAGFAVETYAGMIRYNVETIAKALK
jgi:manganese/zinc/iron transport system substrate-binding protein